MSQEIFTETILDAYNIHKNDRSKRDFQTNQGQIAFLDPRSPDEVCIHHLYFNPTRSGILKSLMVEMKKDFNKIYIGATEVKYLQEYLLREGFVAHGEIEFIYKRK